MSKSLCPKVCTWAEGYTLSQDGRNCEGNLCWASAAQLSHWLVFSGSSRASMWNQTHIFSYIPCQKRNVIPPPPNFKAFVVLSVFLYISCSWIRYFQRLLRNEYKAGILWVDSMDLRGFGLTMCKISVLSSFLGLVRDPQRVCDSHISSCNCLVGILRDCARAGCIISLLLFWVSRLDVMNLGWNAVCVPSQRASKVLTKSIRWN